MQITWKSSKKGCGITILNSRVTAARVDCTVIKYCDYLQMKWSVAEFCGMLAWSLTVQCMWLSVFLPLKEERSTEICYLTMSEIKQIKYAVEANDGFVYDAVNLQHWLQTCEANNRETSVIPQKPITHVTPIRVWRVIPKLNLGGIAKRTWKKAALRFRNFHGVVCTKEASTQTEEPEKSSSRTQSTQTGANFHTNFEWLPRQIHRRGVGMGGGRGRARLALPPRRARSGSAFTVFGG